MTDKYDIAITEITDEGPELTDEQLLAMRGGIYNAGWFSTCYIGGGPDWD